MAQLHRSSSYSARQSQRKKKREQQLKQQLLDAAPFIANPNEERDRGIDDYIVCRECGEHLKRIYSRHLRSHGMTLADYHAKFPDARVQCVTLRKREAAFQRTLRVSQPKKHITAEQRSFASKASLALWAARAHYELSRLVSVVYSGRLWMAVETTRQT